MAGNGAGGSDRGASRADTAKRRAKKRKKAKRARRRRLERTQRAAAAGVEAWRRRLGVTAGETEFRPRDLETLLQPLERPLGLGVASRDEQTSPPRRQQEIFKAGLPRSFSRLLIWITGAFRFACLVLWDWLLRRNTRERRAVRLRRTFEAMGTTFIKLGQQLSMRLDLLPYTYTRELEKMLDRVPPFPTKQAFAAIEQAAGKPMGEVFSAFDPDPIGSASVACVYQGVLIDGRRVAVKVRRPGIGQRLAADMRALGWLLKLSEIILLPPGFTVNFIYELRSMLMEELDFVREARFSDDFRRALRKAKQLRYASAPRVHFDISNHEVMVTEFVTGVWLTDILTAIETNDRRALAELERRNIDLQILARRFLLISRFGNFEHIFFHADLHPANILIKSGNKIVLIDFGSCGSFTKKELLIWRRLFDAQSLDDVGGMVQAAIAVLEPLPPMDKDEFAQRLEAVFWNDLYAIKSKHSEWWERISAKIWISFLKLAREFNIPMRLNTLRMIRAIMLADTIAARLDHDLDPYREYRFYEKGAGKRAKKRLRKRLRRLARPGKFTRLEQGFESALKAVYQFQKTLDSLASIRFLPLIGKAATSALAAVGFLVKTSVLLVAATVAVHFGIRILFGEYPQPNLLETARHEVIPNHTFQVVVLILMLIDARKIVYRLRDRDG